MARPGPGEVISRPYVVYVHQKGEAYPMVFEATRLPSTNEMLTDWINGQIALLDEELDPARGLLYLDEEDVRGINFIKKGTGEAGEVGA